MLLEQESKTVSSYVLGLGRLGQTSTIVSVGIFPSGKTIHLMNNGDKYHHLKFYFEIVTVKMPLLFYEAPLILHIAL